MLQIKDIRKKYVTGELVQTALDGVSLNLRDNEFVAILGPSGSGKTTLLNVIGGLDRYDSGEMIINGISTKKYSDRDWDSYRNHTIGFVFQSYNLIPHQSVLANVELALTISGISRAERRRRAAKALQDVGLGDQLHKRPNQMSGGQMQRVAVARALVNDPDILLADEPTGALDSETSVQIMDLLQEVSRDRLVVMVTHNPELAEQYANRIVRVKDGRILSDSNPYVLDDMALAAPEHKNMGRASMSYLTAMSLSFNNLRTKLARTLLTAFAGSIGIIGIALIMALSTGFQNYIDKIQADTLSNYPLTLQSETADMTAALAALGTSITQAAETPEGTVGEMQMMSSMFSQIGSNDLTAFKVYLEENYDAISHTISALQYSYGISPQIYSADTDKILQVNPSNLFGTLTGSSIMSSYMDSSIFYELLDNYEMLESQYDVVQGRWPESYNEMVLVLSDSSTMTDYMAYALGLKPMSELEEMLAKVMQGQEAESSGEAATWSYDELMALEFKLVDAADLYRYNSEYNVWEDMSDDTAFMRALIDGGETLSIVGIVCPKEGVSATTLTAGVAYTRALTEYVVAQAEEAEIVQMQLADTTIDVFTGQPFGADSEDTSLSFEDMISVDGDAISSAFQMNVSTDTVMALLENYLQNLSIQVDTEPARQDFLATLETMGNEMLQQYVAQNCDESGYAKLYLEDMESIVEAYLAGDGAGHIQTLADSYGVSASTFTPVYNSLLIGLLSNVTAENLTASSPSSADTTTQTEAPAETEAPTEAPAETEAPTETPGLSADQVYTLVSADMIPGLVETYMPSTLVTAASGVMAISMMQDTIQTQLTQQLSGFGNVLAAYLGASFSVDAEKIASAFQFNMDEGDLRRLMEAMSTQNQEVSADANLQALGYADLDEPTAINVYMRDFALKEEFIAFLDDYNAQMEAEGKEEQVIRYTDLTGIMMSSVRTIIDSVSYALIAFVAVSLVVSSIMIGIITYISVMERTKEIGILRAIGASKRNISQVFNAETFIIGLCSGLMGIGVSLLLLIPGNRLIWHLTGSTDIVAQLPVVNALALIVLSMVLTLIGGFIPARQAAKKDPVIALRTE